MTAVFISRVSRLPIILLFALLVVGPADAQTIRLQHADTPLTDALAAFTVQTDVDVVFSRTMLAPFRTSCSYTGPSAHDALLCLVTGLPFRVQEISSTQFVLIPLASTTTRSRNHNLAGFVRDAETGETLTGAHILVPGLGAAGISNDAGFFVLPGVEGGRRRIRATFVGYEPADTVVVVNGSLLALELEPATFAVSGIVVEAVPTLRADLATTPGLVALPPHSLRALPGTLGVDDVLESLRWLPGVERAGEATGGLMIRGSGPDQNLYLVDGVPIYHPWHAFSLVSTFQTGTFKDILLYRGAFPAEYGGRLSSVLDAELRDGGRSGPRLNAGMNLLHARFLMESPISSRSSFMLAGRRSYVDKIIGLRHPVSDDTGRRDTLRTGYYFHDWSAKFSWRPDDRSTVTISHYSGGDVLDLRLPFDVSLDFDSFLRPADLFFEIDQDWGNSMTSVRFQRLVGERLFVTSTLYDSRYHADENAFVLPSRSSWVESSYAVSVADLGAKLDVDWYASLSHQVRMGLHLVQRHFTSDINAVVRYSSDFSDPLEERSASDSAELAAYIQDVWRPAPRWKIQPGLRVSWFANGDYVRASPRLNIQYSIHPERLMVRAGMATQVQYLQRIQDRLAFLYDLVSSRWVPAGPDLPPSRSAQVTAGVEYRPIKGLSLTVDGYGRASRNVLLPDERFSGRTDLIGPGISVATLLAQYDTGEERSAGAEFGLDYHSGRWRIVASYTGSLTRHRLLDSEARTWRPARFNTPRNASLVVQSAFGRWTVGASGIWRSGYPVTVPIGRFVVHDPVTGTPSWTLYQPDINNGRLPPYFRVDAQMAWRFRAWDAEWKVGLDLFNVSFRRNVIGQSYNPEDAIANPRNRRGLPLLPLFDVEVLIQ